MKRSYTYVNAEDVTACKEFIKIMIKRDKIKGSIEITEKYAKYYAYEAAKFFDCMYGDFRYDLEEWAMKTLEKLAG